MLSELHTAQKKFADFETTTAAYDSGLIDHITSRIKAHVAKASFDLAVLDKSGKASAAEMEERLSAAQSRLHKRFKGLKLRKSY